MSGWTLVLVAAGACFALKLVGHVLPTAWVDRPEVHRVAGLVTVSLLAALVVVQTAADGSALRLDARVVALGVAALALVLRAPFLVVVLAAAASAAGLRALGWG